MNRLDSEISKTENCNENKMMSCLGSGRYPSFLALERPPLLLRHTATLRVQP